MKRLVGAAAVLLAAIPTPLFAANAAQGDGSLTRLFFVLAVILLAGKFSGELFERIGQPAVLGELIAGVLLGASVMGIIPTAADDSLTEIIHVFAEIGVVVLLFEVGFGNRSQTVVPRWTRSDVRGHGRGGPAHGGRDSLLDVSSRAARILPDRRDDDWDFSRRNAHGNIGRDHGASTPRSWGNAFDRS